MNTNLKIGLAALVLVVGLPVGCSVINGFNSVATAPGRVVAKTMQTDNIISTYEGFFVRKGEYDARVKQIAEHKTIMAENKDPAEASRLRIELAAMRQSCRDIAVTYNASASMVTKDLFKSDDLPATLSEDTCNA